MLREEVTDVWRYDLLGPVGTRHIKEICMLVCIRVTLYNCVIVDIADIILFVCFICQLFFFFVFFMW